MGKGTTFPITSNKDLKVGVFICHCGGNISDIVDIEELKKALAKEDVEVIEEFENLCSLNGRKIIRDKIINNHLDRVVVAACSPVSHEKTFQDYIKPLNPYLLDMANIREQCSWVHDLENDCSKSCSKKGNSAEEIISCEERKIKKSLAKSENNSLKQNEENETSQSATKKAITLVKASIEKVKQSQAVDPILCQTPENAAVIGGGISGISSALSLAKQGLKTYLIEQSPSIGGEMVKIGKVFSPVKLAEECGMCLLNPIMNETVWHDNIEILTNTKVVSAERRAGNFNLVLENNPRYVDIEKCISCGKCADVCPVKVSDSWNDGLSQRKAIYKPFSQAYPDAYTIDMESCKKCGNCQKVCRMDAIYLEGEKEMIPLNVGSVVLATGHQTLNPDIRPEYGHKQYDDVITQMELGRLLGVNGPTKGKLKMLSKESEGKVPRRIVMV
ncbi:MAG: FAD-dependent oxidoreductase, partial [Methanobacteriaceae archaeon]